jgi:hypothetical protein
MMDVVRFESICGCFDERATICRILAVAIVDRRQSQCDTFFRLSHTLTPIAMKKMKEIKCCLVGERRVLSVGTPIQKITKPEIDANGKIFSKKNRVSSNETILFETDNSIDF